jgi:hypothetical protein
LVRCGRHGTTPAAQALAAYLTEALPADDRAFNEYMRAALVRWPGLSDAEVGWAIGRAAARSRAVARDTRRIATALRQAHKPPR